MFKILITGFEPFLEYTENSSWAVAEKIAAYDFPFTDVIPARLPVSFNRVPVVIRDAVERHNPDVILMLGQSAGIDYIKLERVALNMMDSQKGDNDGYIPDEEPIDTNRPAALFTKMPIKTFKKRIEEQGIPVKISNSAGLYVCNRLYYEALSLCTEHTSMKAIFIHVPLFKGQQKTNGKPTIKLNDITEGIRIIINNLHDQD